MAPHGEADRKPAQADGTDAVAGRIRRLLAMADKRASDLGIPGTEANLSEEMADNLAG